MDLKSLIGKFSGGVGGGAGSAVGSAVSALSPLSALAGGLSSSSSLDSQNQISSGAKSVGGINYAPQNSNLLMIGLIGGIALAGIYLVKKVK